MRGLTAYKKLIEENTLLQRKLDAARRKLAKNCDHPDGFVFTYEWEHDNGYGRQTRHKGLQCMICRRINRYPELDGDSGWSREP